MVAQVAHGARVLEPNKDIFAFYYAACAARADEGKSEAAKDYIACAYRAAEFVRNNQDIWVPNRSELQVYPKRPPSSPPAA